MTTDIKSVPLLSRGLRYGFGLSALWLVLALVSSTTTYHLAPLLVAATPAIVDALERHQSAVGYLWAAVYGTGLALFVTGILAALGSIEGPSLLPTGGALLESILFAVVGGLIGLVSAMLVSRR